MSESYFRKWLANEGLLDFLAETLGTGTGVTKKPYAGYEDLLEWLFRFAGVVPQSCIVFLCVYTSYSLIDKTIFIKIKFQEGVGPYGVGGVY